MMGNSGMTALRSSGEEVSDSLLLAGRVGGVGSLE